MKIKRYSVKLNATESVVVTLFGECTAGSLQETEEVDLTALARIPEPAVKDVSEGTEKTASLPNPKARASRKPVTLPSTQPNTLPFPEGSKVVYQGSSYTVRRSYEYKGKALAILMPGNKQVSQSKLTKK